MAALHAEDLELARRLAAGDEAAWERFVREYRPRLYRAADALDSSGGARELADSLYAELWGVEEHDGRRRSLLRYFEGRSSLATWLRAVLAQRYVDRLRAGRRLEPLPDEEARESRHAHWPDSSPDPDQLRRLAVVREAIGRAIARLGDRDRLRLSCYYVQELTLAETGRVLHEHEATVSRQLARTRRGVREEVERNLSDQCGWTAEEIAQCFELAVEDPGPLDLDQMLGGRKKSGRDRSI